ncbi:MAG: hypothetical protein K1W16_03940 [Lachnospiraceae bacterium]
MKIIIDKQQYEELEELAYIFEIVRFSEEEKVQCFDFMKEIVDSGYDIKNIPKEVKEKMRIQMIDAFEWIESLPFKVKYKDEFLSYFNPDSE